jgi:hypothetical protein
VCHSSIYLQLCHAHVSKFLHSLCLWQSLVFLGMSQAPTCLQVDGCNTCGLLRQCCSSSSKSTFFFFFFLILVALNGTKYIKLFRHYLNLFHCLGGLIFKKSLKIVVFCSKIDVRHFFLTLQVYFVLPSAIRGYNRMT